MRSATGRRSTRPDPETLAKADLHVVLVHPEIHWNTGNIGRTCLAAGAKLHLVRPLGFSLADRKLRRAGLDYWPQVAPVVWDSWEELEPKLAGMGGRFLFSAEAERELWSVRFPRKSVLVFGGESRGLPQGLRERNAATLVSLPVLGPTVRSLNLSTAVGIALYEALRQQRSARPPTR